MYISVYEGCVKCDWFCYIFNGEVVCNFVCCIVCCFNIGIDECDIGIIFGVEYFCFDKFVV